MEEMAQWAERGVERKKDIFHKIVGSERLVHYPPNDSVYDKGIDQNESVCLVP